MSLWCFYLATALYQSVTYIRIFKYSLTQISFMSYLYHLYLNRQKRQKDKKTKDKIHKYNIVMTYFWIFKYSLAQIYVIFVSFLYWNRQKEIKTKRWKDKKDKRKNTKIQYCDDRAVLQCFWREVQRKSFEEIPQLVSTAFIVYI